MKPPTLDELAVGERDRAARYVRGAFLEQDVHRAAGPRRKIDADSSRGITY